jgi:aminopeptidase
MTDPRTARFAEVLVRHSRKVKRGQAVLVVGPTSAEPLAVELYRAILARGAHPHVQLGPSEAERIFLEKASEAQLGFVSPLTRYAYGKADHLIRIRAAVNTKGLSEVRPSRQAARTRATRPLLNLMLKRDCWTLTLWPTAAYAQDAEMSVEAFEDFVFAAVGADRDDPLAYWRQVHAMQARLIRRLARGKQVHIVGPDTDLKMSVAGRTFINSDGTHNMPSGEVFTGPVEDSVEGHVRFSYPVCRQGREVEDVRLVFRKGKVVEASAAKNGGFLRAMLDVDRGARYVGELGIGTNFGIDRFIKNILFDEKIGGSIHIALGNSYESTGGKNRSALHWDMIKDLRDGGAIYVDGKPVQKDGAFLL